MGRIIWIGEVSGKRYEIYESASGEIRIRNVTDGTNPITATSTTIIDGSGVALNAHAARHASGGADPIGSDALRIAQIGLVLGSGSSVNIPAGGTYTIPKGIHYVFLGANTRLELYDDVAASWKTAIAAGGNGIVISDGSNARLYNAGTAAESSNIRSFQ